jgi:hypothetical protein
MHVLFVHQNFPAQFRHIAPGLAEHGWECTFVTNNIDTPAPPTVRKVRVARLIHAPPISRMKWPMREGSMRHSERRRKSGPI